MNFKVSSFCSTGACVEVDRVSVPGKVIVRDTQENIVTYTNAEWQTFIAGVKNNEFDI